MNSNRIDICFANLRKQGKKCFIGYLTAGYPNIDESEERIKIAFDNGVDILELGVPFSDPTADGPVIQEASQQAITAGVTLEDIFEMVERLRKNYNNPIVLFSYTNPLFCYGYERLAMNASQTGIDGILAVDMPYEERGEILPFLKKHGIYMIPLIAPTTSKERAIEILKEAKGFIYYIMIKGVTGSGKAIPEEVKKHVKLLKRLSSLPVAVGFGVSSGKEAKLISESADGVIVGSALMKAKKNRELAWIIKEISNALHK